MGQATGRGKATGACLIRQILCLQGEEGMGISHQRRKDASVCPSCGAAVRPDEVEWLDYVTAECAYCGSPVRGE